MSKNLSRYQKYLALDGLDKAFERAGVEVDDVIQLRDPADYSRKKLEQILDGTAEVDQSESYAEYSWVYGNADIQVNLSVPFKIDDDEMRADREAAIFKLLPELKDAVVARIRGGAYIAGRIGGGTFVIVCGEALCERVLVREDVTEVPDPEMLQEATKDIPMVKKVTPVYEWRCNDAELMAGAL